MHFQESLLPVFLGIIWQASCWILAIFCVGERKSTSEFTEHGRKWTGICTPRSTKGTHKGIWRLYPSPAKPARACLLQQAEKPPLLKTNMEQADQKPQKTSMVSTANIPAQGPDRVCAHCEHAEEQSLGKEPLSILRYLMRLNSQPKQILRSCKWHWSKTW